MHMGSVSPGPIAPHQVPGGAICAMAAPLVMIYRHSIAFLDPIHPIAQEVDDATRFVARDSVAPLVGLLLVTG